MSSDAYGDCPTIEDVKALQRRAKCTDYHVVWFDEEQFVIAHTDEERASLSDLEDCPLHEKLSLLTEMPVTKPGYYMWLPSWNTYVRFPVDGILRRRRPTEVNPHSQRFQVAQD